MAGKKPQSQKMRAELSLVDAAAMQTAADLAARGRSADAVKLLEGIAANNPANAAAQFNLGRLHHKLRNFVPAEKYLQRALTLAPDDAETKAALAFVKLAQGELEQGFQLWREASARPLPAADWVTMGAIVRERGDLAFAEQCFDQAVSIDRACIVGWFGLSRVRKFSAEELGALKKLSESGKNVGTEDRIRLEFALGKACLDQGLADEGFEHYAAGNRLKRSTRPIDISLYEKYADNIIGLFDSALVEKLRGKSSISSARPVFVVGMMRSGSTLTDQILASHPNVTSVGEAEYFTQSVPVYPNAETPRHFRAGAPSINRTFIENLSPGVLSDIGNKYLSLTDGAAHGAVHVVDKNLDNYLWLGLIRLVFPKARIINTVRDPVDTGLSIWTMLFTKNHPWIYDMGEIARYTRAHDKVMRHWKKLFPGEIYEAHYERMVANQEEETKKLLNFCGLPWNDRCLNFHETERHVKTASATQVRQPIYSDSVQKWKKYERHLQPLIRALGDEA